MDADESPSAVGRRRYLSLVGAGIGIGASGRAAAQETATPSECERAESVAETVADERETLRERRAAVEDLESEVSALEAEIERVRAETRRERVRFPDAVRDRARTAAQGVRDRVLAVPVGDTGLYWPAWPLDDGVAVTSAGPFRDENVAPVMPESGRAELPDGGTVEWELDSVFEFDADLWGIATLSIGGSLDPLPSDDPTALSAGDRLVQVTHVTDFGRWVATLGMFERRTDGDPALLAGDVPVPSGSGGAPVVTLDGAVVGMTVQSGPLRTGDDLPEYLDRPVIHETLPNVRASRHLPLGTVRDRVKGDA